MPTMRVPSVPRTGRQTSSVSRHGTASMSSNATAFQPAPSDATGASLSAWPDGSTGALHQIAQRERVAHGESLPVVVEVGEDLGFGRGVREPLRPLAQLRVRV